MMKSVTNRSLQTDHSNFSSSISEQAEKHRFESIPKTNSEFDFVTPLPIPMAVASPDYRESN
jgi:hypothetical protein